MTVAYSRFTQKTYFISPSSHLTIIVQPSRRLIASAIKSSLHQIASAIKSARSISGICGLYERKLKELYPAMRNLTYDIEDLYNFIDGLADLSALLAQKLYEGIELSGGQVAGLITYTRTDGLHAFRDVSNRANIGVKKMGALEVGPFMTALKEKHGNNGELEANAAQLCTLWEDHLRDPKWHPFKIITTNVVSKEFIHEDDEKLRGLKDEYGCKSPKETRWWFHDESNVLIISNVLWCQCCWNVVMY